MKWKTAIRPYQQRARAEAAAATAQRILDAFLERLKTQWFDEITLEDVAEDAAVTVQTVVRRFGGKEGLLSSAIKILGTQINARRTATPGELDCVVKNLIKDYEETGDPVIRLLALEPRHPALKEVLDFGRSEHRRWVANGFDQALRNLDVPTRQRALDALVIATDVYTWKLLRRDLARSVSTTENTIKCLIRAALTQFTKPN
jgi:AcrR family transcriptional regulator